MQPFSELPLTHIAWTAPWFPFIKRTWLETHGQQNNLPDQMKLASIKF
jgi:hypothetical protein